MEVLGKSIGGEMNLTAISVRHVKELGKFNGITENICSDIGGQKKNKKPVD